MSLSIARVGCILHGLEAARMNAISSIRVISGQVRNWETVDPLRLSTVATIGLSATSDLEASDHKTAGKTKGPALAYQPLSLLLATNAYERRQLDAKYLPDAFRKEVFRHVATQDVLAPELPPSRRPSPHTAFGHGLTRSQRASGYHPDYSVLLII
jgi:hypothetical protein